MTLHETAVLATTQIPPEKCADVETFAPTVRAGVGEVNRRWDPLAQ
jgi:hypothetical protein